MINQNLIYALKDPETKEVRYIGKSTIGMRRPKQHKLKYNLVSETHKNHWIKSLISKGLMYEIIILEENIDSDTLNQKEIQWIAHYKTLGSNLTNGTDGGEGTIGFKFKDESKKIMSEKRKLWFKEVGPTQKMLENSYKKKEHKFVDDIEHKHCWRCNQYKQLNEYGNLKLSWDGLSAECRICHNQIAQDYRAAHVDKLSPEEFAKSYEARKAAMSEGLKERYKNDPEYRLKNSRAKSKPILQCDLNGRIIKEFSSALEAKKAGFQNSNVGQAIKYKKPYRGFMWKFKNKE